MAGPILPAEVTISTASLNRVLHYERDDLTVSVEAGMRFSALQDFLKAHGQMVALDPPFSDRCSVGGVLASASSGSLRRGFGTARDMVIGMTFATLDGRLVKTGGMVVKNVAGLDMGKLMIGSFGTLAVITSANFRVHPVPQQTRTYLFASQDLDGVLAKQHELRVSYLRPLAMDLLSPPAAARLEKQGFVLVVKAAGSRAVLDRYARELGDVESISGEAEESLLEDDQ
jgi:glycolate oxidase FAD binding subunit